MSGGSGKLEGRTALVVGAAVGIGEATARCFAAEGANVGLADIDGDGVERLADSIAELGGRAHALRCDVTSSASVRVMADELAGAEGRVDALVYCAAAITPSAPLAELDEGRWDEAIAVNLTGAYLVCKHIVPHMVERGGSIVLVASQLGRVAVEGSTAYCTTKGGLIQLAKGLALDYARQGIRANSLSPGGIATHRMLARHPDMATAQRIWGARHPLGRLGEPDEIARAALYLSTDDSSFMTGADLLVDGGYTAW